MCGYVDPLFSTRSHSFTPFFDSLSPKAPCFYITSHNQFSTICHQMTPFCLAWTEFSKRLCDHSLCDHSFCMQYVYVCSMCMYVVFCKIDHCIHIHWCIVMGLGHNDPWVESHMWPQQTWGQRSSRGQWPLVQVFGKKGQCIHILDDVFSNQILQ